MIQRRPVQVTLNLSIGTTDDHGGVVGDRCREQPGEGASAGAGQVSELGEVQFGDRRRMLRQGRQSQTTDWLPAKVERGFGVRLGLVPRLGEGT